MVESRVVDYLKSLKPVDRVKLFSKLGHEITSPLNNVGSFASFVLEDEPDLDDSLTEILTGFKLGAEGLLHEIGILAKSSGDRFNDSISAISNYTERLKQKITSNLVVEDPEILERLFSSQQKSLYALSVMFGFGEAETFLFNRYVEIYSHLNSVSLNSHGITLLNQTDIFPLEANTRDYEAVIDNLVGNAIKHGFKTEKREGEGSRVIKVTTRANSDPYLVRVADNGVGLSLSKILTKAYQRNLITVDDRCMPTVDLANFIQDKGLYVDPELAFKVNDERDYRNQLLLQLAFLPGISTSSPATKNGLVYAGRGTSDGLGLDIVKDLVERNGGNVWVKSYPGTLKSYDSEGPSIIIPGDTRFYFTIPENKVISKQSR